MKGRKKKYINSNGRKQKTKKGKKKTNKGNYEQEIPSK